MITRRKLLQAAGAAAAPMFVPSRAFGSNSRITVGQIGLGRIAQSHDMPGVIKSDMADYIAVCDLDKKRIADGVKIVEKAYTDRSMSAPQIRTFDN